MRTGTGMKYKSTGAQPAMVSHRLQWIVKVWNVDHSFVHNITVLHISAPFPPFPMPSSNLIGFSTWHLEGTIFMRVIYLLWKLYSEYSDKKKRLERQWSMLNVHAGRPLCTCSVAIAAQAIRTYDSKHYWNGEVVQYLAVGRTGWFFLPQTPHIPLVYERGVCR